MKRRLRILLLLALLAALALLLERQGRLSAWRQQLRPPEAAVALDKLGHPIDRRPDARLSLEARLLYTTLLGRPYGLASEDLFFSKLPKNLSGIGFALAAAARQALQIPDGGLTDARARLDEFLSGVTEAYAIRDLPPDLPKNLRMDDVAMLYVYALVMSGQADSTVQLLGTYADSRNDFTRAFVLMALRAVGTAQAREIIKTHSQEGKESLLAQEALAFPVPNLIEPKVYAQEVAAPRRFRNTLLQQAQRDDTMSILPTFLLGMLGPDAAAEQLGAEHEYLRDLYKNADNALWRKYMYGYAALALRFQEPYEQWLAMYRGDHDLQRRSFILRAMSMQHPDRFFAETMPLFEQEKNAWTQLEYLGIYTALAKGQQLFGPLDAIWMPPLRYRLAYPANPAAGASRSPQALFESWASGRFPQDEQCSHCRQSWLTDLMRPEDEALFLRGYLVLLKRDEYAFGPLQELKDPRLLPVVRYLAERENEPKTRQGAQKAYEEFVRRSEHQAGACCDAGTACLRQQAGHSLAFAIHLESDEAARQYLDQLGSGNIRIKFLDKLQRRARVSGGAGAGEIWEHWLGCWRKEAAGTH